MRGPKNSAQLDQTRVRFAAAASQRFMTSFQSPRATISFGIVDLHRYRVTILKRNPHRKRYKIRKNTEGNAHRRKTLGLLRANPAHAYFFDIEIFIRYIFYLFPREPGIQVDPEIYFGQCDDHLVSEKKDPEPKAPIPFRFLWKMTSRP